MEIQMGPLAQDPEPGVFREAVVWAFGVVKVLVKLLLRLVWRVLVNEFPRYNAMLTGENLATIAAPITLLAAKLIDTAAGGTNLEKVRTSYGAAYRYALEFGPLLALLFLFVGILSRSVRGNSLLLTLTVLLGTCSVFLLNLVAYVYLDEVVDIYYARLNARSPSPA